MHVGGPGSSTVQAHFLVLNLQAIVECQSSPQSKVGFQGTDSERSDGASSCTQHLMRLNMYTTLTLKYSSLCNLSSDTPPPT